MAGVTTLAIALLLTNIVSQLDRYLVGYLASYVPQQCAAVCQGSPPSCAPCPEADGGACSQCKACLDNVDFASVNLSQATCMTGAEYGVLTGAGFSILYAVCALAAGYFVDSWDARVLLIGALVAWSAATMLQATAGSFGALLVCRMILGLAESVTSPSAYALIAKHVESNNRSVANAVFALGVYFGGGLASLSLLLNARIGWRLVTLAVGGCGVLVAVLDWWFIPSAKNGASRDIELVALVEDTPDSPSAAAEPRKTCRGALSEWWRSMLAIMQSPPLVLILVGSSVRFAAGYSIAFFTVKYMEAAFPESMELYSTVNAGIIAGVGAVSALGGGVIGDWLLRTRRSRLLVPIVGGLVAAAAWAGVVLKSNFTLAMVFLGVEYLFAEAWFGPTLSVVQELAPANLVGTAVSVFVMLTTCVGSIAPAILGAVWDGLAWKEDIRWALLGAVSGSYVIASLLFFIAMMRY
jgi:MFS family permease